jgi:anti-sigma regulatory factor (Ser/Thr protein kinase)
MHRYEEAPSNGRPPPPTEAVGARSKPDGLGLAGRWQAQGLGVLSAAVAAFRDAAAAWRDGYAQSRAGDGRPLRESGAEARDAGERLDLSLPLDARAPGAARCMVELLRGRIPAPVVEDALLVVSELVTNSVRHSGVSAGALVVVRVQLSGALVRIEVEDPGRAGVIAARVPDVCGGFGLNLIQGLSERWGLERVAAGGTRVWAQLAHDRVDAPAAGAGDELMTARETAGGPAAAGGPAGGGR